MYDRTPIARCKDQIEEQTQQQAKIDGIEKMIQSHEDGIIVLKSDLELKRQSIENYKQERQRLENEVIVLKLTIEEQTHLQEEKVLEKEEEKKKELSLLADQRLILETGNGSAERGGRRGNKTPRACNRVSFKYEELHARFMEGLRGIRELLVYRFWITINLLYPMFSEIRGLDEKLTQLRNEINFENNEVLELDNQVTAGQKEVEKYKDQIRSLQESAEQQEQRLREKDRQMKDINNKLSEAKVKSSASRLLLGWSAPSEYVWLGRFECFHRKTPRDS